MLSSWFMHQGGDLCWRRFFSLLLNGTMVGLVICGVAGVIDGAAFWVPWWAIMALGLFTASCPQHQVKADNQDSSTLPIAEH